MLIKVSISISPKKQELLTNEIQLNEEAPLADVLAMINIKSSGFVTIIDNEIVDDTFIITKTCTLNLVSAMSGG